jgi:ribosome-associated protein
MPRLPASIEVNERVRIPAHEIELSYARSGGPGGQHVNKTSSKVLLRWSPATSEALSDADRARLLEKLAPRLTEDGELLITSERHREQSRNVDDAVAKLVDVLRAALRRQRKRRKTKPTQASKRRRLDAKKRRGDTKRTRRPPSGED